MRLLQAHFAVVMVTSGLHKLQFGDWWSGLALWYPLHPPFETTLAQAQANAANAELYMVLLNIAAYAVLAWQIGFPAFAWRPRWRPVLLAGAALGWLGTAFIYRLPLFGPAFFIACLAFVPSTGWHCLFRTLSRLRGLRTEGPVRPEPGLRNAESVTSAS
jgi:hypothetical protein